MRTCSALTRDCAYVTKLSKARTRSPYVQKTAEEGTRLGALVQGWIEGSGYHTAPQGEDDRAFYWFEEFRALFDPPPGTFCEFAMGLSTGGLYVPVTEPEPHRYAPEDPTAVLATAGRLDLAWVSGQDAVVLDLKRSAWKYGDPATTPQLLALGSMWALRNKCSHFWVGLYDAFGADFIYCDRQIAVADAVPEVLAMAALPEDVPIPGEHCQGCYERKSCPAAP